MKNEKEVAKISVQLKRIQKIEMKIEKIMFQKENIHKREEKKANENSK